MIRRLATSWFSILSIAVGCGGTITEPGAASTSVGGSGGASGGPSGCTLDGSHHVPSKNDGPAPNGNPVSFAIDFLNFGNYDSNGAPDPKGWQTLGYDIDCHITTSSSTDVCKPYQDNKISPDGPGGRDNAVGQFLVKGIASDSQFNASGAISTGDWTLVVNFTALQSKQNETGIHATVLDGRGLGHVPTWDGNDDWPVSSPRQLGDSYIANGVWVSGTPITLRLNTTYYGHAFYLTVHHAILTAVLSSDLSAGTDGQISGIIDPREMNAESLRWLVAANQETCSASNLTDWRQWMDVLDDGSQDPTKACTGVSVGLGFHLKRVKLGEMVAPEPEPPDPCAP